MCIALSNQIFSESAVIPTPAAAPAPTRSLSMSSSVSVANRAGHLRVIGAPVTTYVARDLDPAFNEARTCTDKSDALVVQFTPSATPHQMEVLVCSLSIRIFLSPFLIHCTPEERKQPLSMARDLETGTRVRLTSQAPPQII